MNPSSKQYALAFDGQTYIDCGTDSVFDLSRALTFEAWVRPTSRDLQITILSKQYNAYEFQVQSKRFVFEAETEYSAPTELESGRWYHLAATFDADAAQGNLKLYIDGRLDASFDRTAPLQISSDPLLIGRRPGWDDGFFYGQLSGILLWNVARTAEQIQADIDDSLTNDAPGLLAWWPMEEGSGDEIKNLSGQQSGRLIGTIQWASPDLPFEQPSVRHTGERHSLLGRARKAAARHIAQTKAEAHRHKAAARQRAHDHLQQAHHDANQTINNTKFDAIYFISKGRLHNVNQSGVISPVDIQMPAESPAAFASDVALDLAAQKLYWSRAVYPFQINTANLDGTGLGTLFTGEGQPITSIALDPMNHQIYWIQGTGTIMRGGMDGSEKASVLDITAPGKDSFWQLALDEERSKLYWTNDSGIWRANRDASAPELVVSALEAPFPIDLAVDSEGGKLYWIDKELQSVRRSNLDGTGAEDLYPVQYPNRGLELDPDLKQIYWSASEVDPAGARPGLAGYWRLDDGDDTIKDQAGHVNHGKLVGARWGQGGPPLPHGRANRPVLEFDGATTYVEIPDTHNLRVKTYTVEVWIRPDGPPEQEWMGIVGKPGPNFHIWLHRYGYIRHRFLNANSDEAGEDTPADSINWNQWNHIVITNDGQTVHTYVNGQLAAHRLTQGAPIANHTPLYIGRNLDGKSESYFKGQIAELRIWNRARTLDQIQSNLRRQREHYMMRGKMDGSGKAVRLFELPCDGGIALASKGALAHEQRLLAYQARQEAKQQADTAIAQAHDAAQQAAQDAHAQVERSHDDAAQRIAAAQASAQQQRQNANQRLALAQDAADRKQATADDAADQKRRQAHLQAGQITADAHAQADDMVVAANDKLSQARKERAKY